MMEPINSHRQEKFMKRILVLLVSMYLVSGSVIAGGAFDEQFKKIDKNGDGQLSRQEFVESSNYKINRKKLFSSFPVSRICLECRKISIEANSSMPSTQAKMDCSARESGIKSPRTFLRLNSDGSADCSGAGTNYLLLHGVDGTAV